MSHLFRGRFELKLDPKGRVSLPSAFRSVLNSSSASLVITNSRFQNQNCLHAYTLVEWQNLEKRLGRLSPLRAEVQAFQRFYIAGGQEAEVDGQSRVLIPQSLRTFAGLNAEIVLVGMGDKFELWSGSSWQVVFEGLTQNFETTLATVAGLDEESE